MFALGTFWDFFRRTKSTRRVDLLTLDGSIQDAALEFQFREVAFWGCVNLIANAMGKCEIKTFERGQLVRGKEWYMWNVQPNQNQNASAFRHRLVAEMYRKGDALVVKEPYGDGIVVADNFCPNEDGSAKRYEGIQVGNRTIRRMNETDVLYLRPSDKKMEPILRKLGDSYLRLLSTAMQNYLFNAGQHWKVHVDQMAEGDDENSDGTADGTGAAGGSWQANFQAMIEKQVAPFLNSATGILPEFDGYNYTQISGQDPSKVSTKEVLELSKTIWTETGRGFLIPAALTGGGQQDTTVAKKQFLEDVIDPLALLFEQEINRKRYTREEYLAGTRVRVDTSAIGHFDIFANAANVEKLIGSGVKSVNELRTLIGDDPIPEDWADKHFLTLNIGAVERTDDSTSKGGENKQ